MCGITGIWRFDGVRADDAGLLSEMTDALMHRGPDDYGFLYLDTSSGEHDLTQARKTSLAADFLMGHRRLSIIDTSAHGRQPMHNETADVFLAFNGEIYNYIELREELKALGHVFRSHTDSEVIIHAYEQWGEDCARRFNGMWAYVLWDQKKQQLICSRDRFGIKPFFYKRTQDTFLYGSEMKAILAGDHEPVTPDHSVLAKYLVSMWRPRSDRSFIRGIEEIPPAHNMIVSRDGTRVARYWDYTDQTHAYDYDHPLETFRELFSDSVTLRLRSDVPVSLLLSGGLDSTAIAALATEQLGSIRMNAFTAEFPGFISDERHHAELVATRFDMKFESVDYDSSQLLNDLPLVVRSMDVPPSSAQVLPRWRLLERAGQQGKVVLEGQGADEALAGYYANCFGPYMIDEVRHLRLGSLRERLNVMNEAWRRHGGNQSGFDGFRYALKRRTSRAVNRDYATSMLAPELRAALKQQDAQIESPFPDHLTRLLHHDHAVSILPSLLRFGDSISMAHSVESRLPFMDYRLVEFLFGLPYSWKMRGNRSKVILCDALHDKIPEPILNRTDKVGFDTPLTRWLKPNIPDGIRPILTSQKAKDRGLFDQEKLAFALDACERDDWRYSRMIFRSLALEFWFQQYAD